MSKATLLELCHGEKKYEIFSISENNESKKSIASQRGNLFIAQGITLGKRTHTTMRPVRAALNHHRVIRNSNMTPIDRNEMRKQMFAEMEEKLFKDSKPEDSSFYYHSSEDRIVLSHALFWVMTQNIKGKMAKQKFLLLLRQYQEEMLEAYLTVSPDFNDLLHYCNVFYDMLPNILMSSTFRNDKDARRLSAIALVACGYGGDMLESLCNELLDDIDFYYNKVKCRKIERMLPALSKMVIEEQNDFAKRHPGVL